MPRWYNIAAFQLLNNKYTAGGIRADRQTDRQNFSIGKIIGDWKILFYGETLSIFSKLAQTFISNSRALAEETPYVHWYLKGQRLKTP